jgi:hypothetical protein
VANYDIAAAANTGVLTGTEKLYVVGKKHATPADLKTYIGAVTPAQLATEQARILALETSQGTQDTTIAGKVSTSAIINNVTSGGAAVPLAAQQGVVLKGLIDAETAARAAAGGDVKADGSVAFTGVQSGVPGTAAAHLVTKAQLDLKADATANTALAARVTALESRDLEIGNTVRSGNFNGVLGQIEPFRIDTANAVCAPPATGTLTDGVEFGVVLYGTPPGTFTCVIDFQTAGQTLQGRTGADANVTITTEYAPFTVRWNATLATWFIVR